MIDFLPVKLYLEGSSDEIITKLYSIFENDIKNTILMYKHLPVIYDNCKNDSDYEEGFWHLISRGKNDRRFDFKRAKRLPWLRPIIENSTHPEFLKWIEYDLNKRGKRVRKTYIWYRAGGYLIILKEIPKKYFLTTAFYVNGSRNDNYYWEKYKKAKKKGSRGLAGPSAPSTMGR